MPESKGYWLFDRNDTVIRRGEAVIGPDGDMSVAVSDITLYGNTTKRAIYRWAEE